MSEMEFTPYGGWRRCVRVRSGEVEAIVTAEVGPRVIRLGFVGEKNEFHENPAEMGKTGGDEYRSYGGHRLWYAPEDKVETYTAENQPPDLREEDGWLIFHLDPNRFGMQKELWIRADGEGKFRLVHHISNRSDKSREIAPWAITVMAPGGTCVVPQKRFAPFPEVLTPVCPLVLWSYTNLADPRFTFGETVMQLRQDEKGGPTKIGAFVSQGFVAYSNSDRVFVKKFEAHADKTYPDMGCNFETFTRQDMLEIESLGPLSRMAPGQTVTHVESWLLKRGVELPGEEAELLPALKKIAEF